MSATQEAVPPPAEDGGSVPPPAVPEAAGGGEAMFKPLGDSVGAATGAGGGDGADEELASDITKDITVLPSLCVACEENGRTSIFMTKIPFFRDVILMSFRCQHCGYRSSEVQEAEMQEKGCRFTVNVETARDLNRQLIKSNYGVVKIPHIDFEIPRMTQQGVFTTVEGLLVKAAEDLAATLPLYKAQAPEQAPALEAFLGKLQGLTDPANMPYALVLEDSSGNSFLENPFAPEADPNLTAIYFTRNVEQNHSLGLYAENALDGMDEAAGATAGIGDLDEAGQSAPGEWSIHTGILTGSQAVSHSSAGEVTSTDAQFRRAGALIQEATDHATATMAARAGVPAAATGAASTAGATFGADGALMGLSFDSSKLGAMKEVMTFPCTCFACAVPGETRMCVTDVPHFREIIIMAFTCDACGHKDVEVKAGGAIPDQGTVYTLRLEPGESMAVDLRRDCIKSDSASVQIPELEFSMEHGSLGGMYTTVEGLLSSVEERLRASNRFDLEAGDSAPGTVVPGSAADTEGSGADTQASKFKAWFERFTECKEGLVPFTLILRDPLASSYIWSPYDNEETGAKGEDPRLTLEHVPRTPQEDIDLGVADMVTEGYQAPAPAPAVHSGVPSALPEEEEEEEEEEA